MKWKQRRKRCLEYSAFLMAERLGFEPRVPLGDTAFRVLHHRPLGHLSKMGQRMKYNATGSKMQLLFSLVREARKQEKTVK